MLVHLGNAYFAPYETRGCVALCACSARANAFHLLLFPAPTGQTVGTADAKLTSHMYVIPTYMFLWLPTVVVGSRLHAPGPKKFIREGSPESREYSAIDNKFGTLIEFNEHNSMLHVIS